MRDLNLRDIKMHFHLHSFMDNEERAEVDLARAKHEYKNRHISIPLTENSGIWSWELWVLGNACSGSYKRWLEGIWQHQFVMNFKTGMKTKGTYIQESGNVYTFSQCSVKVGYIGNGTRWEGPWKFKWISNQKYVEIYTKIFESTFTYKIEYNC